MDSDPALGLARRYPLAAVPGYGPLCQAVWLTACLPSFPVSTPLSMLLCSRSKTQPRGHPNQSRSGCFHFFHACCEFAPCSWDHTCKPDDQTFMLCLSLCSVSCFISLDLLDSTFTPSLCLITFLSHHAHLSCVLLKCPALGLESSPSITSIPLL